MICFSVLQVSMMGTAEEMKELISKGTFMAFENRIYLAGACNVGGMIDRNKVVSGLHILNKSLMILLITPIALSLK
jgi:hypothetical protein